MRNIKAILLGLGAVGKEIVRGSYQKGVDYVAAFNRSPRLIGQDIGHVIGGSEMGASVLHIDEMETFIEKNPVDIAIITVPVPFEANALPQVRMLLSHKINVLTALADVYVMERNFPDIFEELDALAKANGVTFFASGIQDVFWTALPVALTGCSLEIKEIKGVNVALIDHFGPGVADECYVGWELDKFNKANESGELPVNDFLIALYEIAKKLGLHPYHQKSMLKPLLAKQDAYFATIDRHVKAGQLLGNYVESFIKTEEGIILSCEMVSKMSEEGDTDLNSWEIIGVPNINLITEHMQGEITTGSNIVNRIPDVINAAPGVASASKMAAPFFKAHPLNEYIK